MINLPEKFDHDTKKTIMSEKAPPEGLFLKDVIYDMWDLASLNENN